MIMRTYLRRNKKMRYFGEPTTKSVYLDVFGTDPNAPKGWRTARKCRMTDGNGNEVLEGYYTKETRAYLIRQYVAKGHDVIVTEHKTPRARQTTLGVDFESAFKEVNKLIDRETKGGAK